MAKDEEDLSLPWLVEAVNKGDWDGIALPDWHDERHELRRGRTMERGQPDTSVYTFEVKEGRVMDYPDAELFTRDYEEARAYADQKGYLLIENTYEWADSELLEDFTKEEGPEEEPTDPGPARFNGLHEFVPAEERS